VTKKDEATVCRSSPPQPSIRRADIQGLRAIAVFVVVAFHAGLPIPGGFVGVDMFFVISGFVITAMLQRQRQQAGHVRLGNFYLGRFKRLIPALAFMVGVTLLVSIAIVSPLGPQQAVAKTALGAMLLVANVVIARSTGGYFDADASYNPLLHTWTLSVEEQFYFVFPALLLFGWALGRRWVPRLGALIVVGCVAAGSFALTCVAAGSFALTAGGWGFYNPFSRAWEFAAGALLALVLAARTPRSWRLLVFLGAAGLGLVVASILIITPDKPFPGPWTTLPVAGTLLLLVAGTRNTVPTSRFLSIWPMVRLGDLSYSIYLWHWPCIAFAGHYLWQPSRPVLLAAALVSSPLCSPQVSGSVRRTGGGLKPYNDSKWRRTDCRQEVAQGVLSGNPWELKHRIIANGIAAQRANPSTCSATRMPNISATG
jgi:peptidoglycan/LPS O-acetylase OafA/YrhL